MSKPILIIEDDKDIVDILEFVLAEEGFTVVSASSALTISEVKKIQPAMILLDNRLAVGYGGDFCKLIKQNPETSHLPVIIVSGNADIKNLTTESMADGYIAKPFDLYELLQLVNSYCNAV